MMRYLCLCMLLTLTGCATSRGPYTPQTEGSRDTAKAQALTQKAAAIIESDSAKAESLLRDALTADVFFGPAHNNLGTVFLRKGDLFAAANEFEWAGRLLPGLPEPRTNLALTLEKAGRIDEALATYATALEAYKDHMPSLQAMTRLQVKSGRTNDRTRANMEEIALKGLTQQWREWARLQLAKATPSSGGHVAGSGKR